MFYVEYFNGTAKRWMRMGCLSYASARRIADMLRNKNCGPTAIVHPG